MILGRDCAAHYHNLLSVKLNHQLLKFHVVLKGSGDLEVWK